MRHLAAYVLAVAAFVPFGAGAAPQILGIIATAEPVPLTCALGVCQAEFSSVCLQRNRDMPKDGTAYNLVGDQVTLVITGKDGSERRMPAANRVGVRSAETYTAVIIAIPRDTIGPDAERIAISVDRMAAAVPEAEAGDPNPLGEDEITLVTGPKLKIAERTILQKNAPDGVGANHYAHDQRGREEPVAIRRRPVAGCRGDRGRRFGGRHSGRRNRPHVSPDGCLRSCAGSAGLPVRASPRHHAGF